MQATVTKDANKAVIKLNGRFDFNTHRDFRAAYEPLITDAIVKNSKTEFIVLNEFMNWVKKHNPDIVAGHNIKRFDLNWIRVKTAKYNMPNLLELDMIDTLEYATKLHKDGVLIDYKAVTEKGRVSFKLEHLVRYFGLDAQTHRAIDDVYQNIIVYKNLKELEGTVDYGF